jgi:hypothetical protein
MLCVAVGCRKRKVSDPRTRDDTRQVAAVTGFWALIGTRTVNGTLSLSLTLNGRGL